MISLAEAHPELVCEWSAKNEGMTPFNTAYGSGKKVIWECRNGHEWSAVVKSRSQGNRCPICSGQKVLKGYNDFETICPDAAKEWSERNLPLLPSEYTAGSEKKVWWVCHTCKYEWSTTIAARSRGTGCPVCAGKILIAGINDLATENADLAAEWAAENGILKPEMIRPASRMAVMWECGRCGYKWRAVVRSRVKGLSCPACEGKRLFRGVNDLSTLYPTLSEEWSILKNRGLTPDLFKPSSHERVYWTCASGHTWYAKIIDRVRGAGCPVCKEIRETRFLSKAIIYYAERENVEVLENAENIIGIPIELMISDKKTAIEFGDRRTYTAARRRWENGKNWLCMRAGIKMIRILTAGVKEFNNCICISMSDESSEAQSMAIKELFRIAGLFPDVDVERDKNEILNLVRH